MNKENLCKEIGTYFGSYFEESGQLCIDNGENIFRYDTADALLSDWLDTLIENHHDSHHFDEQGREWDSWEKEIVFIYSEVIGKYPTGIRCVQGNNETKWACSIDVTVPGETSSHGKNLHLGTYTSIVDAIYARRVFKQLYKETDSPNLSELTALAERFQDQARRNAKLGGKAKIIDLYNKVVDFNKANKITAMSPVSVMLDLSKEINVTPEELYILADKLIDGIYSTDSSFLYGERLFAIQYILENGIDNYYLGDMDSENAYQFLLNCSEEEFIAAVDITAQAVQEKYPSEVKEEDIEIAMSAVKNFTTQKEASSERTYSNPALAYDITPVKNLISAMTAYGMEFNWNDSDIIGVLEDLGVTYEDFCAAGAKDFVENYFKDGEEIKPSLNDKIKSASLRSGNQNTKVNISEKDMQI